MTTTLDNQLLDRIYPSEFRAAGEDLHKAVLRRAAHLGRSDQMLVQLVLRGNITRREMAALIGAEAGTICRRMARLAARLHDPLVVALTDDRCPLPPDHRQIGIEHFLRNMSVRELADLHQMSQHVVRGMLTYIRGWHKGISQRK